MRTAPVPVRVVERLKVGAIARHLAITHAPMPAGALSADQHLVLRIDLEGMPPGELLTLTDAESNLPTRAPSVSGRQRLTGLWLIPEFSHTFVWWTEHQGWNRTVAGPRG